MPRRAALVVLLAAIGFAVPVAAQIPTRPPVRPAPTPARPDTIRGDTLRGGRRDSLSASDTVTKANFAPPDSVMQRLLGLPGYTTTKYQAETITFDALTRAIQLTRKAIVERDSQIVKSDTISYGGVGSGIRVGSDSGKRNNIFVAPGQAPVISSGPGTFDIATRSGTVTGFKTSIPQSGETLQISGEKVKFVANSDSVRSANDATFYVKDGTVTACPDSVPDYYFKSNEIKRTGNFVVARPAVLYIGDVPVMWLPFLFQDIRSGRRSGIITPNLGVSDFVRNSPSYRRNVEGLGYYFAISDFIDAQVAVDWRSSAGESEFSDPGYMRYNGEFRYRWLDRFLSGNLALAHTLQAGSTNTAISWGHQQSFTRNSSLSTNLNYVTSTTIQRNTTVNPYSALATISSQANYQHKLGPAQFSLGGSQKQYPGRTQLDRSFPTMSLTTSPLNIAEWLSWTPSFSYASTQSHGIDQPTPLGLLLRLGKSPTTGVDSILSDTLRRSAYSSDMTFDTPIVLFGNNFGSSFSLRSARNDFPERAIVTDVLTGVETERIYAQTYHTEFNWTPSFTLPAMARNNFNLTPSVSVSNVDGGPFAIRNERTGGKWVHQSKRLSFGVGASPTLFGLFSGFGPFQRFRHSFTPSVSYSYAPASNVDNEYLAAVGRTKYNRTTGDTTGYLGALAQNALSFGISTNIEAKMHSANDSNPEQGDKLKVLSLNFTSLNYDFERARFTHSRIRGLTTQNFGYTLRSDLLPGIDIGVDYSLFEGSTLSDSAKFKPYRERVTGAFSFSNTANPFAVFSRLFGRAVPATAPNTDRNQPTADDRYARQIASQPVAGRASRTAAFIPTATQGWQASFTFTSARQRPPVTPRNVVEFDPAAQCVLLNTPLLRLQYDQCIAQARLNPSPQNPFSSGTVGSPIYLTPPTTSLGSNLNFNLTQHWAASWQTQYDFEAHNFASQIVSLQRDLHDWRAIFAFTQSPNGSFAFNFLISLKAEPELKFDYHKATYRNEGIR